MQKIRLILPVIVMSALIGTLGCSSDSGDNSSKKGGKKTKKENVEKKKKAKDEEGEEETPQSIKEGKGVGPVENVELSSPLNEDWAKRGKAIHGQQCASCHKLTDKRAVGPGWAGITNKRKPEWIMNMIMNTSVMLEKDPDARKQLEECATRMPNQNLSRENARKVLEFMRKNDMEKVGQKDQAAKT